MSGRIGVFDSGVGGLSVARMIWRELPELRVHYFADTAYVPYGERPAHDVVHLVHRVIRHLLLSGVRALVMACNTATALALEETENDCPMPVIGMIKPAVAAALQATRSGRIGVISNTLTASCGAYQKAAPSAQIFSQGCPQLVMLAEAGQTDGPFVRRALREYLTPLMRQDVDTLILGCTHFPFFRGEIERMLGPSVKIIDPAHHVLDQIRRLGLLPEEQTMRHIIEVSGNARNFERAAGVLLGEPIHAQHCALPNHFGREGGCASPLELSPANMGPLEVSLLHRTAV